MIRAVPIFISAYQDFFPISAYWLKASNFHADITMTTFEYIDNNSISAMTNIGYAGAELLGHLFSH